MPRRSTNPRTLDDLIQRVGEQRQQQSLLPDEPMQAMETIDIPLVDLPDLPDDVVPTPAFVDSVRQSGILQPILVSSGERGRSYRIVDGRRRVQAARVLGYLTIPGIVATYNMTQAAAATLVTNTQRSANPRSEFEAIEAMVSSGYSVEEIAETLHLPLRRVERRYAIARLIPPLRAAFAAGTISYTAAAAASQHDAELQQRLLVLLQTQGSLVIRDVAGVVTARAAEQQTVLLDDPPMAPSQVEVERLRQRVEEGRTQREIDLLQLRSLQSQAIDLRNQLNTAQQALVASRARAVVAAPVEPSAVAMRSWVDNITSREAQDVVAGWLATRITLPEGTTLRGRITQQRDGGGQTRRVFTLALQPPRDADNTTLANNLRALAPQARRDIRQQVVDLLTGIRSERGDWTVVGVKLTEALAEVPVDSPDADAGYQVLLSAMNDLLRYTGAVAPAQ